MHFARGRTSERSASHLSRDTSGEHDRISGLFEGSASPPARHTLPMMNRACAGGTLNQRCDLGRAFHDAVVDA
jgi:hypothetical protein